MKQTFKEVRKTIPLNEFIYIGVRHNIEFTTVKKISTKYDSFYVDSECLLGNKKYFVLSRH